MNRVNKTKSAVFNLSMLYFQRTPFSDNLEVTTSVVVPCGGPKARPVHFFSVVISSPEPTASL